MLTKILRAFSEKRKVLELCVGLGLLALMSIIAPTRWFDQFEMLCLDWHFHLRSFLHAEKTFPDNIALIGVDESSIDALGRWPWAHKKHAEYISYLNRPSFRPGVLTYDILMEERDPAHPGGDDDLVYGVKKFGSPVVMPYFFEKGRGNSYEEDTEKEKRLQDFALSESPDILPKLDKADKVSMPFLELAQVCDLGFPNTSPDADGRTRWSRLLTVYKGKIYPSLDLVTVLRYAGADVKDIRLEKNAIVIEKSKLGEIVIPINSKGEMLINYYGNTPRLLAYPFIQVLDGVNMWMKGGTPPDILKKFKDKIVLVGATALGLEDRRVTPFNRFEYGVRLHAQVIANILDRNFLLRAPAIVSYLALFFMGFGTILITMFRSIARSLPTVIGMILIYFVTAHVIFLRGVWIDFAIQTVTMIVLFIGITSFRYFTALEELKRTQEQLIQSTKMASLGQLSAGISHEFRNILNAINLHVEYCSRPGVPPERVTKYMGTIKDIMGNANLILNGLLTFARKSESVKKPGHLKKTVEDTLLLIEKEMMRHEISVVTELEEVPEIPYDAGQISQVIMNLMNNARDALKDREGKQITLRVKNDSKGIRLDIGDNGSGIPPQVMKHLFEPFVTSKPAGKGTGLGLSVCHGIIRNHGGDITVTTGPEKGTTWHISFPKE